MCFADGTSPPDEILRRWLDLTEEHFRDLVAKPKKKSQKKRSTGEVKSESDGKNTIGEPGKERACVAVHCVAGLGRYMIALLYHVFLLCFSSRK